MATNSRPILMQPGPIEYSPEVLAESSKYGISHVDPLFISTMQSALNSLCQVVEATDGEAFILAGSGSLGWESAASNLLQPSDHALVINIGYFGDSFGRVLEVFGAQVTHLRCPVGERPSIAALQAALRQQQYKVVTITHVDTSTAVISDVPGYTKAIREIQPNALVLLDGVCSVGGEELRMTKWDVDFVLTGSQKCIGVPAGLSLQVVRPRALNAMKSRTTKIPSSYCNLLNWLPIMQAYKEGRPSYFATPATNLVMALKKGLDIVLERGMEQVYQDHQQLGKHFRAAMRSIGLHTVASEHCAANTLSGIRYPTSVNNFNSGDFIKGVKENGVIIGGGLHKDIKSLYFRVGHMGPSSRNIQHILQAIVAIENSLAACGYKFSKGEALLTFVKGYKLSANL